MTICVCSDPVCMTNGCRRNAERRYSDVGPQTYGPDLVSPFGFLTEALNTANQEIGRLKAALADAQKEADEMRRWAEAAAEAENANAAELRELKDRLYELAGRKPADT